MEKFVLIKDVVNLTWGKIHFKTSLSVIILFHITSH